MTASPSEAILPLMVDDLLCGRVTSFRREQGFGVITLDDGRDVPFDASHCTMVPEEGAAVRLRVGPAKWGGGIKALHVEPRGSSTLFVQVEPPSLDQQIAALQREHLVGALSEQVMAQLTATAFGGNLGDAALLDVLDAYYAADPTRARHDAYVRDDRLAHAGADLVTAVAALAPDAQLPRPLSWSPTPRGAGTLRVRLPDGSDRAVEVLSPHDIVSLVNETLRAADDPRRLYPLDTRRPWHAFLLLPTARAQRLISLLPFATAPQAIN